MRLALWGALFAAATLNGCVAYEFEEEFWFRVDGSGSVSVTGRPELWRAFKNAPLENDPREAARHLFEASGLSVRRVTLVRRRGREYLFVAADFRDLNALAGTPAFPDLKLSLGPRDGRLLLEGVWSSAAPPGAVAVREDDGLMAVRFHLPSKVYAHQNATGGVERGNIVGWRQDVAAGLKGAPLHVGATLDPRSILWSTVSLFGAAIAIAVVILGGTVYLVARKGRARAAPSS
jgi:hypothetical protein